MSPQAATRFADVAEPVSHLQPPSKPDEFKTPLDAFNEVSDLVSPTAGLSKIFDWAFGEDVNPVELVKKYFAGDWEAYVKCGQAWRNLSAFCEGVSENIKAGNELLDGTWDGNAADAAFVYFDTLRRNLLAIQGSLAAMGVEYETAAYGVWSTAEVLGQIIAQLCDQALLALIKLAATSALGWTVIGAVAGLAAIALEIEQIADLWSQATAKINTLQMAIDGIYGQLAALGGEVAAGLNGFPLPRASYDFPDA